MMREVFKRQKIPDGLVPVVCVEPIVVPERFKSREKCSIRKQA